jgi:hypothetical protein
VLGRAVTRRGQEHNIPQIYICKFPSDQSPPSTVPPTPNSAFKFYFIYLLAYYRCTRYMLWHILQHILS